MTVANNTADTTAPAVTITAPASGATVSGTQQVTANASDNVGVAGVLFYLDGSVLGTEATAAPYAVSWITTGATNGTHTLTAVARDAAGNHSTSAPIQVTVANSAPVQPPPPPAISVSLTSPTSGTNVSGTVTVSALTSGNVVGVRFYVDTNAIGLEGNFAPFAVSWNTATTADGTHTLTAVARDLYGTIVTSAGVTVTVKNGSGKRRATR